MISLPSIPDLIQRTKALAALDLILSPEWQYRFFSFNSKWATGQQMASMRDGCGDEWWIVFDTSGWAAGKGLAHDSNAWRNGQENLSKALQAAIPSALHEFANEPAFRWDETSFAYFKAATDLPWRRGNDLTQFAALDSGEQRLLWLLVEPPSSYVEFAADYFEVDVPLDLVEAIYKLSPISDKIVRMISPDAELAGISEELFDEIGYPR